MVKKRSRRGKVLKFAQTLDKLRRLPRAKQYQAVRVANNKFLQKIADTLNKIRRAKVSAKMRQRLRQKAPELRAMVSKRTPLSKKRQILTQRGGILPLLMGLIPAIGSIAGSIIQATT